MYCICFLIYIIHICKIFAPLCGELTAATALMENRQANIHRLNKELAKVRGSHHEKAKALQSLEEEFRRSQAELQRSRLDMESSTRAQAEMKKELDIAQEIIAEATTEVQKLKCKIIHSKETQPTGHFREEGKDDGPSLLVQSLRSVQAESGNHKDVIKKLGQDLSKAQEQVIQLRKEKEKEIKELEQKMKIMTSEFQDRIAAAEAVMKQERLESKMRTENLAKGCSILSGSLEKARQNLLQEKKARCGMEVQLNATKILGM